MQLNPLRLGETLSRLTFLKIVDADMPIIEKSSIN